VAAEHGHREQAMPTIPIPVRWYPTVTAPDVPCREPNGAHLERTWELPVEQTALVLVDCWDSHPIETHLEHSAAIIDEVLVPLLEACRDVAMTIVHAPSPPQAKLYPQWLRYAGNEELGYGSPPPGGGATWPPAEFRRREGEFAVFERPTYLRDVMPYLAERRIVECIAPAGDDYVVATGEQLHRLLRHRGILHLLYVGFATNMCILHRDYGLIAMHGRGYDCVLLRDGTVGIEAAETYDELGLTRAAVYQVEMLFGVSSTAAAVTAACRSVGGS